MYSPTTGLASFDCWQCNNVPFIVGERQPTVWKPITREQIGTGNQATERSESLNSERSAQNTLLKSATEVEQAKEAVEDAIRRAFEEGFTAARAQTSLISEDGPRHSTYRLAVDAWPISEASKTANALVALLSRASQPSVAVEEARRAVVEDEK
jgi:hypothetical protein